MRSPCVAAPGAREDERARDAWSSFWQEPGQSRCVDGSPDVWRALSTHWSAFAAPLPGEARVLDLGCGAGAVARALLDARADLHVTGIDFARIPFFIQRNVELLADTAMEDLPFADASFPAIVSQFGFEYGHTERAAREMARVLAPGGRFSFITHHAASSIVSFNRARLNVLTAFLHADMRAAFCGGDAETFNRRLAALTRVHPDDLLLELQRSLPFRMGRPARERAAIWAAIEEALAPELCLLDSMQAARVAPDAIEAWLAPLRTCADLAPVSVLRKATGEPIAWRIAGVRV
ncbi:MAG: class I SAM-dependent methyltransferase [Hyphomonadaceae bacterium]